MKTLIRTGAGLLIVTLLMIWAGRLTEAYILGGIVLLLDIWIAIHEWNTVSEWVHDLFGRKTDLIVLAGIFAATFLFVGAERFLYVLLGGVIMHLFGHKNI